MLLCTQAHHDFLIRPVRLSDCIHRSLLHVDSIALNGRQLLTQHLVELLLGEFLALADEVGRGAHWIVGLQTHMYTSPPLHTHTHMHGVLLTGRKCFPHLPRVFGVRVGITGGVNKTGLCRMVEDLRSSGHDLTAAHTQRENTGS